MALAAMIQKFARNDKPIRIYRYGRGEHRGGVFTAKLKETFSMLASVQPIQTDFLHESNGTGGLVRKTDAVKIFSVDEILLDDPSTGQKADRIEINGVMYEAKSQGSFRHPSLGHFETVAVKVADK
jgi:hypothetical protein